MAFWKGFRAALHMPMGELVWNKTKSFGLKKLQPEIAQIADAVDRSATRRTALLAGGIGAPVAGLAYLAGRSKGKSMNKHAGIISKYKQLVGRETKVEKLKRVLANVPDEVKEHLAKQLKTSRMKAYAGGTGIGAAGLLGGYAVGKKRD